MALDPGTVTQPPAEQIVGVTYTNYRGETSIREIVPVRIWFGSTDWHPQPQWLLDAFDVEKEAFRSFAMRDISDFGRENADRVSAGSRAQGTS